jgi:branched-chain amino acid aminotransferase
VTTTDEPVRTPRAIAWVDGRVIPASEATVPLLDDGFLRGDAVFDAMLVRAGRSHARAAHLDRLRASGRALGLRVPVVTRVVEDLLAAWGEQDGALKVIVTRAGNVRGILSVPVWPPTLALHAVEMPWRTALSGVKTLSYAANQWAVRQAVAADADDALIVAEGVVQELPTGAIVVVRDGRLATPDPDRQPILRSITVTEVRKVRDVEATTLTLDDVRAADEVFVVSATRPVLPVHAVDDVELPAPGPVTADVRAAFAAHVQASLD